MTLVETLTAELPPISVEEGETMRVGGTRVTLDSIVFAFHDGRTAEQIQQSYPSLTLAHVYAAIAYYLQHQAAVETYLARRAMEAADVRQKVEKLCPPDVGFRARLLARKKISA